MNTPTENNSPATHADAQPVKAAHSVPFRAMSATVWDGNRRLVAAHVPHDCIALFAAAPDLLAALERLRYTSTQCWCLGVLAHTEKCEQAQAAHAKAKGVQP